ncbi:MAG: MBOAT family protein [Planctomycetes bacterium]|nr:MBOAT family protein [Planctomycetota bacterium]
MLFNTLDFALFLVLVVGLYHLLAHRAQNVLLLLASYWFYGAWDWRFAGLLFLSTTIDYWIGRGLGALSDARRRRWLLGASVAVNLGILGSFKYFDFFVGSAAALLARLGVHAPDLALHVVLPVGVSFYTFQELSYTIDVYRGQLQPARRFVDFALFVSFFPQLVAGPIERATALLPQIQAPRRVTWQGLRSGAWLILWGTFKKVFVADNLGNLVDAVYARDAHPTGPEAWLAVYAFAFQIYGDFSGYSDVARGSARLLGFELMHNFEWPYFATSLRDLWRRWHISLTTWLRDYLYIPLGGNRVGTLKHYRNMLVTMLLCGLWHGAAWTFVVWGLLHAAALMTQHALTPWTTRVLPRAWPWKLAGGLLAFHLWCLFFVPFRAADMGQALDLWRTLFSDGNAGMARAWLVPLLVYVAPLLLVEAVQRWRGDDELVLRLPVLLRASVYALVFAALVLLAEDHARPFIYFQF